MSDDQPTNSVRAWVFPEQNQAALRAAIAEVDAARRRPYYDAAADRVADDRYYEGVDVAGLGELVTQTHRQRPRYQPAVELYPWVDLQPDRSLRSLYTGHRYDPADLIADDFRIAEQHRIERAHIPAQRTPEDATTLEDMLERTLPYNCEHVVPQSWFGKKEPMRGDLHHLFACESRCNSFRGNTPYTEFPDFPTSERAVRSDCGKSEDNGFEPAQGKGAAARAVFYFLVRYPADVSAEELPRDRLDMLLDWHGQAPVSEWERHRNATIFERQGNRNPFIDHPEWADNLITALSAKRP